MKRDPDLIRQLLFYFDKKLDYVAVDVPEIEGHTPPEIRYHMLLLAQAGFLDHEPTRSNNDASDRIISVLGFGLTWRGHEFLDAARNETYWGKIRQVVGGGALDVTFQLLKEMAIQEAKNRLGFPGQ